MVMLKTLFSEMTSLHEVKLSVCIPSSFGNCIDRSPVGSRDLYLYLNLYLVFVCVFLWKIESLVCARLVRVSLPLLVIVLTGRPWGLMICVLFVFVFVFGNFM